MSWQIKRARNNGIAMDTVLHCGNNLLRQYRLLYAPKSCSVPYNISGHGWRFLRKTASL